MKIAVINVKSDPSLKEGAEAFARELGISLSDLVNLSLRYALTSRSLTIDLRPEPNEETARLLRAELADIRRGKTPTPSPTFSDAPSAFLWLKKRGKR
jgi:antitoxin component of RelBE/YafQ-DinJ toxin-antitoxin module